MNDLSVNEENRFLEVLGVAVVKQTMGFLVLGHKLFSSDLCVSLSQLPACALRHITRI
jgi:hypothetical protein